MKNQQLIHNFIKRIQEEDNARIHHHETSLVLEFDKSQIHLEQVSSDTISVKIILPLCKDVISIGLIHLIIAHGYAIAFQGQLLIVRKDISPDDLPDSLPISRSILSAYKKENTEDDDLLKYLVPITIDTSKAVESENEFVNVLLTSLKTNTVIGIESAFIGNPPELASVDAPLYELGESIFWERITNACECIKKLRAIAGISGICVLVPSFFIFPPDSNVSAELIKNFFSTLSSRISDAGRTAAKFIIFGRDLKECDAIGIPRLGYFNRNILDAESALRSSDIDINPSTVNHFIKLVKEPHQQKETLSMIAAERRTINRNKANKHGSVSRTRGNSKSGNQVMGNIEEILAEELSCVVGQDAQIKSIIDSIHAWLLLEEVKPLNLIFTGPTGTGKDLAADAIAAALGRIFDQQENNIQRYHSSIFIDRYSNSLITGTRAGLVGHDVSPLSLLKNGVLCISEADKLPPYAIDTLYEIQEGSFRDGASVVRHLHRVVIILTCNAGDTTDELSNAKHTGFIKKPESAERYYREKVLAMFHPALLSRTDSIIGFNSLGTQELAVIAMTSLKKIVASMPQTLSSKIIVADDAGDAIAEFCDTRFGARTVSTNVNKIGRYLILNAKKKIILEGGLIRSLITKQEECNDGKKERDIVI